MTEPEIQTAKLEDRRALLVAQYNSVRAELLQLMQANDKRTLEAVGVSGTIAGILIAAANAKLSIPGVAFLLPAVYLLMSISIHYKYSARVAGMGSFLASLVDSAGRADVNWERDIKLFATHASGTLSTKLSVATIYFTIIAICLVSGANASFIELSLEPTALRLLDACATVLVAMVIPVAFYRIVSRAQTFVQMRTEYDRFWSSTIATQASTSLPGSGPHSTNIDAQVVAPTASEVTTVSRSAR